EIVQACQAEAWENVWKRNAVTLQIPMRGNRILDCDYRSDGPALSGLENDRSRVPAIMEPEEAFEMFRAPPLIPEDLMGLSSSASGSPISPASSLRTVGRHPSPDSGYLSVELSNTSLSGGDHAAETQSANLGRDRMAQKAPETNRVNGNPI